MDRALQKIFQEGFEPFSEGRRLPLHYYKAAYWLRHCRTARLGGHVQSCPNGHVEKVWYNSCRHRACPQCNALPNEQWLERERARLLSCPHRHLIFTIPHELNSLWMWNRRVMMDMLFRSVHATIQTLLVDPRYLGAQAGFVLTLHTWSRSLSLHPHIHVLVSEGGLDGSGRWRRPRKSCFLPARVVMALFRGKLLGALRVQVTEQRLRLPEGLSEQRCLNLINRLGRKKWNVRIQSSYAHRSEEHTSELQSH